MGAIPGQRPDIEKKIALISDRVVRGTFAKKNRAILLSRVRNTTVVVGSALMSVGLTNPLLSLASGDGNKVTVNEVFSSWHGVPKVFSFAGVALFLVIVIALAFYRQGKVEEKAIQAMGLAEAFDRLEIAFRSSLEQEEPIQQLNAVYNNALALETSYFQVMPKKDACRNEIEAYIRTTIKDFCDNWGSAGPGFERREK